jgi:predicted  nucleic acid-binding Zn-ribbon protein
MKVVSFRMEESEIDDLLRDTQQSESSNALRHVIQEWKELRVRIAEKEDAMVNLQEETKGLRTKIEEIVVELSETKEHSASSIKSITVEKNKLVGLLSASESERNSLSADLSSLIDSERKAKWV